MPEAPSRALVAAIFRVTVHIVKESSNEVHGDSCLICCAFAVGAAHPDMEEFMEFAKKLITAVKEAADRQGLTSPVSQAGT